MCAKLRDTLLGTIQQKKLAEAQGSAVESLRLQMLGQADSIRELSEKLSDVKQSVDDLRQR